MRCKHFREANEESHGLDIHVKPGQSEFRTGHREDYIVGTITLWFVQLMKIIAEGFASIKKALTGELPAIG